MSASSDGDHDAPYAVTLPGPGLGDVPVSDVVEFLRGVVDLVAIAAQLEASKPVGQPGRRGATIESASKVRLMGLSTGSLIAEIAPAMAKPQPGSLELDVQTLSQASLDAVFETAEGQTEQPQLAAALISFAERMNSRRPGQPVVFVDRRQAEEVVVPLDAGALDRLRAVAVAPAVRAPLVERVTGRLYEANVESDEARVRTPSGDSVKVEFDSELEPEIKRLLGDRTSVIGEVDYDPQTHRVREIRAREIDMGVQLEFDGVDFWRDPDLSEIAASVGAKPVEDPSDLHLDATDAEWDELYRVLADAG